MKLEYFNVLRPIVIDNMHIQPFANYLLECRIEVGLNRHEFKAFDLPHIYNIEALIFRCYAIINNNYFQGKKEHKVKFNMSELATCNKLLKYFAINKTDNSMLELEYKLIETYRQFK